MAAGFASLEASVEAKLSDLSSDQWRAQQPFTIFRVPSYLRESSPTSYEPRLVSIGPYYRGTAGLQAMEDHKWRYLEVLLSRSGSDGAPEFTASSLIAEMRSLEARARACYSERPVGLGSDDFVEMLFLDSCFILEFFFKWHHEVPDALCDVGWGLTFVLSDLLLMENQIPFFVLERLYDLVAGANGGKESLLNLLVTYFVEGEPLTKPSGDWDIHHLLHLFYQSFVPKRKMPSQPDGRTTRPPRVIPSATEMSQAGVTFMVPVRKNTFSDQLRTMGRSQSIREVLDQKHLDFEVVFNSRNGVMEIPTILIDDAKKPLLANLIAFEQSLGGQEEDLLTSYVALMGQLIVTARDVELLRHGGVLENLLANDEDAARFFNHLGDCGPVNHDSHAFVELYEDVTRYCGRRWNKNMAALRRDYFASPWSAIASAAVALGLALTATQTYLTVFPSKN